MSLCQAYTIVAEHEMGRPIFGDGGFAETTEDVPQNVKFWVLLHVATLYENRASADTAERKVQPYVIGLLVPFFSWESRYGLT